MSIASAADIGILALAAGPAVRTEGHDIDLPLHAGVQVLVLTAHGSAGSFPGLRFPVPGIGPLVGSHERLQTLLGRGKALIVQLVKQAPA